MAFVFKFNPDEVALDTFTNGVTALALLGTDVDICTNYFVDVSLTPLPGGGRHDLSFHILAREVDTGSETIYWDGRKTKHIIPTEFREATLYCVFELGKIGRLRAKS